MKVVEYGQVSRWHVDLRHNEAQRVTDDAERPSSEGGRFVVVERATSASEAIRIARERRA
jgi:hypothetical protein